MPSIRTSTSSQSDSPLVPQPTRSTSRTSNPRTGKRLCQGDRVKLLICLKVAWEKLQQPRDSKFSFKLYDILKADCESWGVPKCPKYQNVEAIRKQFLETNSIDDKKRTDRKTIALANEVSYLMSQPGFSLRTTAVGLECSKNTINRIARKEIGAYFYSKPKYQALNAEQIDNRFDFAKKIMHFESTSFIKFENIIWTDECMISSRHARNRQNDGQWLEKGTQFDEE